MRNSLIRLFSFMVVIYCVTLLTAGCPSTGDDDDDSAGGYGAASIDSNPRGAAILFDNVGTGKWTPATIEEIAVGIHALRLTLGGYQDWTAQITIEENKTTTVFAEMIPDGQPTPTPTVRPTVTPTQTVPTATPTTGPGALPNLRAISIQTSGGKITSFTWENNGTVPVTVEFYNMIYVNVQDPPYYHWQYRVQPPVAPGVYTTSINQTLPAEAYEICLLVDHAEVVDETDESLADNFYCRSYP